MEAVEEARRAGLVRTTEYLLVDSASTDRTLEIASRFPLRIVRLEPSWPLSCGAGCYVGLLHARGTFTAIVNGDMTVDRRWFVDGLPYMDSDVGAVCGVAKEDLQGRTVIERLVTRYSSAPLSVGQLSTDVANRRNGFSTGTFLVRTEAARMVGSYNPFFRAAEDMDLRYRLVRAGWKVLNLPVLQGVHYWPSGEEPLDVPEYFGTIFRNSVGLGQMARYNLRRDVWVSRGAAQPCLNARILSYALLALLLLALLAVHILAAFTGHLGAIGIALLGDAIIAASAIRGSRRWRVSPRDQLFATTLYPPVFGLVRVVGFIRGFLPIARGPGEYPATARMMKG